MPTIQIFGTDYNTRPVSGQELQAGINVFQNCFGVRRNEKVLIICDESKLALEAPIFFQAAKQFSTAVRIAVIPPSRHHGEEPPAELVELMMAQDIILIITTYSLSHTNASRQACAAGARIASMPGISVEMITRTLTINYQEIASLTKKVAGMMTIADSAHLTSQAGTEITFSLRGRSALADTGLIHNPHDFGNLPAGEAYLAPEEGKSEGILVFDGAFADILIDQPIRITIHEGQVDSIEGGNGAQQLNITLAAIGHYSRNIAELGIGTNRTARLESSILEVEKVYGTVHVALGNNVHIGGEVDVAYHADGVILKPSLTLDNRMIIKDGEFLI